MKHKAYTFVTDQDNQRGLIEVSQLENRQHEVEVLLAGSQRILIPADMLTLQSSGSYLFSASFKSYAPNQDGQTPASEDALVIPVIAEELSIDKQWVETGRVRVTKHVHQTEEMINELLLQEQVDIQRVPVNRIVEQIPEVRYEGESIIVPLVEEELVIEKRIRLKEEIHIMKRTLEKPVSQSVTLQKEEVNVERIKGQHFDSE